VAAELVRRGHAVDYFSYPAFAPAIEATGATFHSYAAVSNFTFTEFEENLFRLAATMLEGAVQIVPALLPRVAALAPNVVIHDSLAPWGRAVGEVLARETGFRQGKARGSAKGVARVCSVTTFAMNNLGVMQSPVQMRNLVAMGPSALARLPAFMQARTALRTRYGVAVPSILSVFSNPAPQNMVFTSRAFQPVAASFSQDAYHFVGPPLAPRLREIYTPPPHTAGLPLVYVSLGTLYNARVNFYRACIAASVGAPWQMLLSVGHRIDLAALGALPANVTVARSVPQVGVLRLAALFLTHGGMNSTQEALYQSVPLLIAPQAADQEWVAQRVARLDAGRILRMGASPNPASLRAEIASLLADSRVREGAHRVGASLRAAGGAAAAADLLEAQVRDPCAMPLRRQYNLQYNS
jgi:MGT family glycosyltransferase